MINLRSNYQFQLSLQHNLLYYYPTSMRININSEDMKFKNNNNKEKYLTNCSVDFNKFSISSLHDGITIIGFDIISLACFSFTLKRLRRRYATAANASSECTTVSTSSLNKCHKLASFKENFL